MPRNVWTQIALTCKARIYKLGIERGLSQTLIGIRVLKRERFISSFLSTTIPVKMSLIHYMLLPYLMDGSINDFTRPTLYDQHFRLGVNDFISDFSMPVRSGYLRPWRFTPASESGLSHVVNDKDSFKINLDVQQFKPEELAVKVVDRFLVVEGKHEERGDEHGYISRQFVRRYYLPDNVDENAISTSLSSDGILQLTALKKPKTESENERVIPIMQSNQPVKPIKGKEEKLEPKPEQKPEEEKKQDNPPK